MFWRGVAFLEEALAEFWRDVTFWRRRLQSFGGV